ncbi:unnamed protein product [Lupinus luteus]|uniref:Condensin-2 complex subunit H2 n=1 Tax=Lupinus luteus TaxID=3873 RepID=A0AAV1WI52_LUPLU
MLSTTDLYQDFILLDASDAVAVDEFMKGSKTGIAQNAADKATLGHKNIVSPAGRSGGSAHKSSATKSQQANPNCSPKLNCSYDDNNLRPNSPMSAGGLDDCNLGFNMDDGFDPSRDSDNSDSDDPWKPLNPHEPGNLRVKPFRKVKSLKKNSVNVTHRVSLSMLFPVAKLHGPISPELMEMWEMRRRDHERRKDSQSAPIYEKLRQTLTAEVPKTGGTLNSEADNDDNEDDIGNPDFDMPWSAYMDEDLPPCSKEHEGDDAHVKDSDYPEHANSQESLEDLCRSHLNALLASIAESEKQTEMAARVSTWKQRIEHHLEKQESHPPFDIRDYGERILDKLSLEESSSPVLPFSDLVSGQEKYDVARSFSSLLQLVNNGEVNLERNGVDGESVCYTDVNTFHVKLLEHNKKREDAQSRLSKKRATSRTKTPSTKGDKNKTGREKSLNSTPREYGATGLSPPSSCKFPIKLGKASAIKLSPEAKRKRRSLHSAG